MSVLDVTIAQSPLIEGDDTQAARAESLHARPARRQRAQSRWLIISLIFNIIAIGVDWLAIGAVFQFALAIRLWLILPLLLMALGLQRWSSNLRLRSFMTGLSIVVFVATVAGLGQYCDDTFASRYMMVAIFTLFVAILFANLPLAETVAVYTASTLLYALIVITSLKMTIVYTNIDLAFLCVSTCGLAVVLRKRQDAQMAEIFRMRAIDIERSIELGKANERLARLSTTDSLTGVFNRRHFDDMIDGFAATLLSGANYSALMIDVDHFKRLNDHSGHSEGDRCLRLIATALQNGLRSADDNVVRYGGEEFAVILRDADLVESLAVAERLRRAIVDLKIPHPAMGPNASVSVSIGVHSAPISEKLIDALKSADKALYLAKQSGRNRVATLPQFFERLAG